LRRPTAPFLVILASSACAGPTVNLPHVAQSPQVEVGRVPQPETPTQDVKPETAGPTAQACKKPSAYETLATPEAAVNLYVESIAANDFGCALRAYAAHEHATRFDFTALVQYTNFLIPWSLQAPPGYPMFVEMNELRAKADMAQATKLFVYGLLMDADPMRSQNAVSDAQIQAFIQAVNPARLAKLRVVRIDQPRRNASNSSEGQKLFREAATREGADEMIERIALYDLSGQSFWSGFQLCRYDKKWKIYGFQSNYAADLPPSGGVVRKTTAAEYAARLQ
jgi:hypothetical protein